ncbi:unnamed protein product, partial [marine sediment metagenome]
MFFIESSLFYITKTFLHNIQKIIEITDYPILIKQPNLRGRRIADIMKESFGNIEKARLNKKQ